MGWLLGPVMSWNFWIVVITVLPVGCSRIRRRWRTLSARSGFGKPHAVKTPAIWPSSLVRSVTMTIVGCCWEGSRRSLSASQSIVRLLPEPCVCQTMPPRALGLFAVLIRPHRLVHGDELPVAGQLADGPAAFDLEDDEIPDDVEEISSFEEPVEQDVLWGWGAPESLAELSGG